MDASLLLLYGRVMNWPTFLRTTGLAHYPPHTCFHAPSQLGRFFSQLPPVITLHVDDYFYVGEST